jgi:hypothetical protein
MFIKLNSYLELTLCYVSVLCSFCFSDKRLWPKPNWGCKVLFHLKAQSSLYRETMGGAPAVFVEVCCHWFALHGLLGLLSFTVHGCDHLEWAGSSQSLIKKIPGPQFNLREAISQLRLYSHFLDNSSVFQFVIEALKILRHAHRCFNWYTGFFFSVSFPQQQTGPQFNSVWRLSLTAEASAYC